MVGSLGADPGTPSTGVRRGDMPDPQTTTADERRGGNPAGQAAVFGFLGGLAGLLLGHGSWGAPPLAPRRGLT